MWEWRPFEKLTGVDITIAKIDDHQAALGCEEYAIVASAVQARVREFTAGRNLARFALGSTGIKPATIPVGPDGQPTWPSGITGSISHTATHVAVAAAKQNLYRGVGIDIEVTGSMNPQDISLVLTSREMDWLCDDSRSVHGLMIFSCKEAAFKAVFSIVGEHIDFTDVEVTLSASEFQVAMAGKSRTARIMSENRGLIATREGLVATIFYINQLRR